MKPLGPSDPRQIGPYRVYGELGRGGMGRVLLAGGRDGRLVALKLVHAQHVEDPGFRERFRREVNASRRVSGAYTAAVVDADAEAELPWLATLFVPGPSLREAAAAGASLPGAAALRLAAGLAAALEEIHGAGLVHRDLKPSNVLLAADGARVIDFGVARATDGGTSELTHTGWLVGSPGYMSPEQAESKALTPASDVFSLGAVLYLACTGVEPFMGASTPATLYNVVHSEPDLELVAEPLRAIVEACIAKDPAARPTPGEVLARVGTVPPSARAWPESVYGLIARQDEAVAEVLRAGEREAAETGAPEQGAAVPETVAPAQGAATASTAVTAQAAAVTETVAPTHAALSAPTAAPEQPAAPTPAAPPTQSGDWLTPSGQPLPLMQSVQSPQAPQPAPSAQSPWPAPSPTPQPTSTATSYPPSAAEMPTMPGVRRRRAIVSVSGVGVVAAVGVAAALLMNNSAASPQANSATTTAGLVSSSGSPATSPSSEPTSSSADTTSSSSSSPLPSTPSEDRTTSRSQAVPPPVTTSTHSQQAACLSNQQAYTLAKQLNAGSLPSDASVSVLKCDSGWGIGRMASASVGNAKVVYELQGGSWKAVDLGSDVCQGPVSAAPADIRSAVNCS